MNFHKIFILLAKKITKKSSVKKATAQLVRLRGNAHLWLNLRGELEKLVHICSIRICGSELDKTIVFEGNFLQHSDFFLKCTEFSKAFGAFLNFLEFSKIFGDFLVFLEDLNAPNALENSLKFGNKIRMF